VIGGAFNVLNETGAVEFGIKRLTRTIATRPTLEFLLIPALMVTFSLAGSIFGMAEELIPFVIIFIPLARSLGYDSIVGECIPFLGAAAGFAAAFFNPFTVGVAQKLAGLPPNSGLGYRVFSWFVGTAVVTAYVMLYARKVKKNPTLSPVYELDLARGPVDRNPGVDAPWLVEKIRSAGSEVVFVPAMDDVIPALRQRVRAGDTVIFFGGDDLFRTADAFAKELS